MASYLTPEWLMQDIGSLLNPMTKEEFKEEGLAEDKSKTTTNRYYVDEEGNRVTEDAKGRPITGSGWGWYEDEYGTLRKGPIPGLKRKTESSTDRWTEYEGDRYGSMEEAYEQGYTPGLTGDPGGVMWDSESLAGAIGQSKGIDPISGARTSFTPEMFKKLRTEYYQPQIEEQRGSLIDKLIGKKRLAGAEGGGFAGYGGRERAGQQLAQSFTGGVEDIYAGIEKQKTAGLQDIYDIMSQYESIE